MKMVAIAIIAVMLLVTLVLTLRNERPPPLTDAQKEGFE